MCPKYDTKPTDSETLLLEFWWMRYYVFGSLQWFKENYLIV